MNESRIGTISLPAMRRIVLPAMLCALLSPDLAAGVIHLTLRDEHGSPLSDIRVVLSRENGGDFRPRFAQTSANGTVSFDEVPEGQYRLAKRERDLRFVRPEHNPFAPEPRVTLAGGQQRAEVEWELWRGVEVYCRVNIARGEIRSATVHFHEVDLYRDFDLRLGNPPEGPIRLVPGRWQVMLEPIDGLVLQTVEVDGAAVTGYGPFLELEPMMRSLELTWNYAAPAEIYGRVTFDGKDFPVGVVARLVEPGPWIDEARRRGGSSFDHVRAGVRLETGTYEMKLPDGVWEVRPAAAGFVSSDPEMAMVRLAPEGSERADFRVGGTGEETSTLTVTVATPDSEPPRRAVVEVWPLDPAKRQEGPERRGYARYSTAVIRGLAAGDYLVAAAAESYVEGLTEVAGFGADEAGEPRPVEVTLQPGATLHAVVSSVDEDDDEDRNPPRVLLTLEKLIEETGGIIRDTGTVARALTPRTESDMTGHAWLRGLYPGKYRVTATLRGRTTEESFVRIRNESQLLPTRVIEISEAETHELELVVVPAANIAGSLVCSDEGALPGIAGFVAVDVHHDLVRLDEKQILEEAALRVDNMKLTGERRDRFQAGPLEDGFYHVALRPAGHDRWTWALGTERAGDAATVQGAADEPTELGVIELDCGPVILLEPKVAGDRSLPDLRGVTPGSRVARVSGNVVDDGRRREVRGATVESFPGRVLLRGLPEGVADLNVVLINEYFLPEPRLNLRVEARLERGRTLTLTPVVAGIGGRLVLLDLAEGGTARLTDPLGERRLRPVAEGRAVFDSLPSGSYHLELCSDPDCEQVKEAPFPLTIEPLRTLELSRTAG